MENSVRIIFKFGLRSFLSGLFPVLALSVLSATVHGQTNGAAQPAPHAKAVKYVVLVTIDGFRPDFYMDPSWNAPNLRHLMQGGVYAERARGIFPTVTYPSHTTIITGAFPARHGIYYNAPFEPETPTGKWNWYVKDIKAPTLWDAARAAHLKTAAVLWPVTVGADIDYNIPEIWSTEKGNDRVEPMKANTTPKGLWEEVEQHATGKLTYNDLNAEYVRFDENIARMASYVLQQYRPNFLAVHFACVDEWEHNEGRDGPGVRLAVAGADHAVGKIVEAIELAGIKDSTAIIVTGDHGFGEVHDALLPNVWLTQKGFIKRNKNSVEWTARFQPTGGSAFLYLKDPADKKTLAAVRQTLDALPESQKKLFHLVEKDELTKMGVDSAAMLGFVPARGFAVYNSEQGAPVRPAPQKGVHGYLPDNPDMYTGFIGYGAGFKEGTMVNQIGLEDIAPLIARLLGIPFNAPDGVLYPGLLSDKK